MTAKPKKTDTINSLKKAKQKLKFNIVGDAPNVSTKKGRFFNLPFLLFITCCNTI